MADQRSPEEDCQTSGHKKSEFVSNDNSYLNRQKEEKWPARTVKLSLGGENRPEREEREERKEMDTERETNFPALEKCVVVKEEGPTSSRRLPHAKN